MGRRRREDGDSGPQMLLAWAIMQYRLEKGWTQRQMAAHLETVQSTISQWETGEGGFELNNAARVARLIGLEFSLVPISQGLEGGQQQGQDPEQQAQRDEVYAGSHPERG